MAKLSYNDSCESEKRVINRLSENIKLNNWEKGFIKNIKEYTEGGGFLSNPQKITLSKIWEKY